MFFKKKKRIAMIEKAEPIIEAIRDDWNRLQYYIDRYQKTRLRRCLNICNDIKDKLGLR